ncbi:hypothetical protein GCM10027511_20870 [Hymenobacter humi]
MARAFPWNVPTSLPLGGDSNVRIKTYNTKPRSVLSGIFFSEKVEPAQLMQAFGTCNSTRKFQNIIPALPGLK